MYLDQTMFNHPEIISGYYPFLNQAKKQEKHSCGLLMLY
jgi:hypothetical protein